MKSKKRFFNIYLFWISICNQFCKGIWFYKFIVFVCVSWYIGWSKGWTSKDSIPSRDKRFLSLLGVHAGSGVRPSLVSHVPWVLLWPLYKLLCRCCIECVWFAASAVDCQIYAVTVEGFVWGSDEHWTSRPVRETKWYEKCVSVIHLRNVGQGFQ